MNSNPLISVVLGSFNRLPFLKLTIDSIRKEIKFAGIPIEIIVVDGGSSDGSIKWLTKQKDIISIIQHNNGFWNGEKIERKSWGFFMNLGFKTAHGKYVCMISDDCLIVPGAIKNGYELFEKKLEQGEKVGALAFYWRNWPEKKYMIGLTLGKKIFVNHGMYLKTALEEVDYIDESFRFYYGDSDLCLKIWNSGYFCIESPDSYIEHYAHAINSKNRIDRSKEIEEDILKYKKKWTGIFYNENDSFSGGWMEKEFYDSNKTVNQFIKFKIYKDIKKYFTISKYYGFFKKVLKGK